MASQETFDQLVEHFLAIVRLPESDWTQTSEKRGVLVAQKTDPDSALSVLRGRGSIKSSAEAIADVLADITKRASWDVFFESGNMVKWIKENELGVAHMKFKGYGWTVWPRDFAVLAGKKKLDNGQSIFHARSFFNRLFVFPLRFICRKLCCCGDVNRKCRCSRSIWCEFFARKVPFGWFLTLHCLARSRASQNFRERVFD